MDRILNSFVNTGADDEVLNRLDKSLVPEDLEKAIDRSKLVQKEVQVKGKNGQMYTRKQWVKATDVENGGGTAKQKTPEKDKKAEKSKKFDLPNTKDGLKKLLASGVSRNDIMSAAKEAGITWKENGHEGINWMRASMALTNTNTRGNKVQPKENKNTDNSNGKLKIGQTVYTDAVGSKSKMTVVSLNGEYGKITVKNSKGTEYDVPMNSLYSSKEDIDNETPISSNVTPQVDCEEPIKFMKNAMSAAYPKLVFTNNGFSDLEKDGKSGYGVWVGYQHGKGGGPLKAREKMMRSAMPEVKQNFIKFLADKGIKANNSSVKTEDFVDKADMFRVSFIMPIPKGK
jgi:hypothetical protein